MTIYQCKICNKEHQTIRSLSKHISSHKHSLKSYYDSFLKKEKEGSCLDCGKETRWQNMINGYTKKCRSCRSKDSAKKQWSNESGNERKQKLSIKMIGNNFSAGRPKYSRNKNKYPENVASLRAKKQIKKYGHNWLGRKHSDETIAKMSISAIKRIDRMGIPKTYKGKYKPIYPEKYKGNLDNIVWRSSWELTLFKYLDKNPNVIEWSSEEVIVPYISPVDNRYHRYYPDVVVKLRKVDGSIITVMLEVKPAVQTKEPKPSKKKTQKYITEVMTWGVNQAKWKYAQEYCQDRGWEFRLITEKELGLANK